jgi:hypothetical protein
MTRASAPRQPAARRTPIAAAPRTAIRSVATMSHVERVSTCRTAGT